MANLVPDGTIAVYVDDWPTDEPQPGDEWAVWNAPRPLAGDRTWAGTFRHGIFYAAVRRDNPNFEKLAEENWGLHGEPVVLVTDAQIREAVVAKLAEYNYTLDNCGEVGIDPADVAADMGMPWKEQQ